MDSQLSVSRLSRRALLGATAALAVGPAVAEECRLGPAPHEQGPRVFMDMDQQELDASYNQLTYEPFLSQITKRLATNSEAMRARIGAPQRESYGPSAAEGLDIYRAKRDNAPIFVFIHGGAWLGGAAKDYGYPAEMFVNAGAHYVAVDFVAIKEAGGDLGVMAKQVRSAVAWVHNNAAKFGGDPAQLYVGGHSSGGHLCGVVMVTDWQKDFGLAPDIIKGGMCMSGMYEMDPVALSARRNYVRFTDAMKGSMSAIRHIDRLSAPITVTYGTFETPDFQRQSREFAAAVKAQGKPVRLIAAANYAHLEMCESLGNPYGANGRAALEMMTLG
jgi:arylformamidase